MEKWFKFYSADFLIDGKIRKLNANERSCLITLLCLADTSDIPGEIRNLDPDDLTNISGVSNDDGEMILTKFEAFNILKRNDNGMITMTNFRKRQGKALNTYQRVKLYRERENLTVTKSNEVGSSLEEKRREEN